MGNFREYGQRADKIAKEAFQKYKEAEERLRQAEAQKKAYPVRGGMVYAETAAKAARAEADYIEAKSAFSAAKTELQERNGDIEGIRRELAAAIEDSYSAKPSALDAPTLELLKANILTPQEYGRLMNEALNTDNHTMVRLISKYAGDAAEKEAGISGPYSDKARELRGVAIAGGLDNGKDVLARFDVIAEAYRRTSNNTAMIDDWAQLTENIVNDL
jgi:hypothetical protein